MSIFEFEDYKNYINHWIKSQPKEGRGELRRIALFLNVSSVLVSQIFRGDKEISLEQGLKLSEYIGLNELEIKYFLKLIQIARSGNYQLTEFYEKERVELWQESQKIATRVPHEDKLSDADKSKYYSDWRFSAVRLSAGLSKIDKEKLKVRFDLTDEKLDQMLNFMIERKLIRYQKGEYSLGPASTHIGKDAPQVVQHHSNWRIKSLDTVNTMTDDELMYTAPMSISYELFGTLKERLLVFIDEFVKDATESESEELFYLNIDLRKI